MSQKEQQHSHLHSESCGCHSHEEHSCCAGHSETEKKETQNCGCSHHHQDHSCGCSHDHSAHEEREATHKDHACSCGHDHGHSCGCGHSHDHCHDEHGDEHSHCCCHHHGPAENSMDSDWDASKADKKTLPLLMTALFSVKGVKDVELLSGVVRITHTPESLEEIKEVIKRKAPALVLKKDDDGKVKTQIHITEMDCPTEEGLIRAKLKVMDGVSGMEFNLMNRILTVRHLPGQKDAVCEAIRSLGYTPDVIDAGSKPRLTDFHPTQIPWWKYGVGFALALASEAAHFMSMPDWISLLLALAAVALVGVGTYKKGLIAVRNFNFNMNALMAVAVTGAILIGSWSEGAMVMVLFELSEAIEQLSLDKARSAIRSLLSLTPDTALVKGKDGGWTKLPAKDVKPGDVLRVGPGERLPVDGKVLSGHSAVNQAPITGESMPVEKKEGDQVFGGTINENGSLDYEATSSLDDSMPARIIAAIESAQGSRAPTQKFVDVFAKYYTPTVFVIAILTAFIPPLLDGAWFDWIYKALTLLVIACPCALVISTPVTIVSGLANAARKGILIKGGIYLEKGRTLKHIALDKTGTITEGNPTVEDFMLLNPEVSEKMALEIAAELAARNSHPVSAAALEFAEKKLGKKPEDQITHFELIPGVGVLATIDGKDYSLGNMKSLDKFNLPKHRATEMADKVAAMGCSPLFLSAERGIIAVFAIADKIRETSCHAIKDLHSLGINPVMLTGDNEATAQTVASKVGIKTVRHSLMPADKLEAVEKLSKTAPIGMVGDGINDAPALARADIGFAMGAAGTDTAIETADVALMDDDLRKLPEFVRLSKTTFTILVQNICIALAIKFIFFVLTFLGLSNMWMAVFADTGTCLIVVANGMRVLGWNSKEKISHKA